MIWPHDPLSLPPGPDGDLPSDTSAFGLEELHAHAWLRGQTARRLAPAVALAEAVLDAEEAPAVAERGRRSR